MNVKMERENKENKCIINTEQIKNKPVYTYR